MLEIRYGGRAPGRPVPGFMAETHATDKTPATNDHDSSCQRILSINLTHRSARELLEMNTGVEERRPSETKLKPTSTKRQHAGGIIQHD